VRWEDRLPAFRYDASAPLHSVLVPTVDTARYGAVLAACLAAGAPALLVGDAGAGKSALVARQLAALAAGGGAVAGTLTCSARTGAATVQALLLSKLTRRQGR
jgi:dynein heavy chain